MGPKKTAAAEAGERKKEKVTLEMKKEIIRKHDGGMCVTDLAREYRRNPSTIGTILKMREKILATDAAKGVTRIVKNRPAVLEEVEKLLVEEHDHELTTQELVELQAEAAQEQASLEEEEATEERLSSKELKDICQKWKDVQAFAQRHHPDKDLTCDLANTFDTRVMSSFREVLKRRMKQQTMDRFFSKKQRVEEEPSSSCPPES
ncbi:uncharacterized protein LOC144327885 [Podarcis muralis]